MKSKDAVLTIKIERELRDAFMAAAAAADRPASSILRDLMRDYLDNRPPEKTNSGCSGNRHSLLEGKTTLEASIV